MHPCADWPADLLIEAMRGHHTRESGVPAPEMAPPSAAELIALLDAMPNPESTTRAVWVDAGLATAGCSRALDAAGQLTDDQAEAITAAWVGWAERWPLDDDTDHRQKFESDFAQRDRDLSGWRHLLALADQCGLDTSPWRHAAAVAEFGSLPPETAPVASAQQRPGLRMLSPADCAAAEGRGYIVKGLLAPRDLACFFGPPGAGKSVLGPHVGYAVARGCEVFGRRTRAGGVFYVAAEDPHGMRQRIHGLKLTHGDAPGFALVEGVGSLFDAAQADELRKLIALHRPSLVFVDTLAMAFPGLRENESEDMGRVVAAARSFAEHGAAVVLIHHDPKESNGTPRGHSLFNGALDMSLQLVKADDSGVIQGTLAKNRNGPCYGSIAFRIQSVPLGADEDGDMITTPVAAEADASPKQARLPRTAMAALAILREMVDASDDGRIAENDWRQACSEDRRVSTSEERKSRATAFRRAFDVLLDQRQVVATDGYVSPVIAGEFAPLQDDVAVVATDLQGFVQ